MNHAPDNWSLSGAKDVKGLADDDEADASNEDPCPCKKREGKKSSSIIVYFCGRALLFYSKGREATGANSSSGKKGKEGEE